ncbi:hypothetical protein V6S02_01725, partial [Microbacterium sp. CCNWLW134]|uniref:hypothetical protein n=1 Tax=Microbacterium sp. CCNWLW134 TaxID=3122064 RepID=UPI00301059CC
GRLLPLRALRPLAGRLLPLRALRPLAGRLLPLRALRPLWALLSSAGRLLPLRALLSLVRLRLTLGVRPSLIPRRNDLSGLLRRTAALWGHLSLHLSLRRRRLCRHCVRRTLAVTALLFRRRVLREDIVHERILSRAPAWGIGARLRGLLIVGHRRTLRGDRYGWSVSSV